MAQVKLEKCLEVKGNFIKKLIWKNEQFLNNFSISYFNRVRLQVKRTSPEERKKKKKNKKTSSEERKKKKNEKTSSEERKKKKNEKLIGPESEGQLMSSSSNNPRIEVVRRLRERLEPIILFGETEQQALKRLRAIEVQDFGDYDNYENDYEEEDLRSMR